MSIPVVYVLKNIGLCGGVRVVLEHVSRLMQRGYDASVYYVDGDPKWFKRPLKSQQFLTVNDLKLALSKLEAIKVATWWETAYWIAESRNDKDRAYYLVQDIEESYAVLPQHKEIILGSYRLGLKPIVDAMWVKQQLAARFGQQAILASIGVDFDVFKPLNGMALKKDPSRILTQCRTWTSGPNLKGWRTAKDTIETCFDTNTSISAVTFSVEAKQQLYPHIPHIHIQSPTDEELNELYNTSGVFLLSSEHEGFGLVAAEAMAVGLPVVSTYADGNEEFCVHNKTAMMASIGDHRTLAKHIDYLFKHPDFAATLADQAKNFIKQYSWDRVLDVLEDEYFIKPSTSRVVPLVFPPVAIPETYSKLEHPKILDKAKPALKLATIIIPTVNDYKRVSACVDSIRSTTIKEDVDIVVVDDGTQDESTLSVLEQLASSMEFMLVTNRMNLGFSASVNRGMLERHNSKYIILCNNDITFISNWLYPLATLGDSDPRIGIIGGKLLYPDGRIQHAGMDKAAHGLFFNHAHYLHQRDCVEASESKAVWAVTGALFAIKQEALATLGGFSTAYCTAWEDVDYCLHAWRHGYQVYYCAQAEAVHLEGGTRGASHLQKKHRPLMWAEREKAGQAYFMQKWLSISECRTPQELN